MRLIGADGDNAGVVDTKVALADARARGLDLIEVSPKAQPPVARILDYSKLKYEERKESRKQKTKQKKVETKGIRLSVRISTHDRDVRLKQAGKFLLAGDKVKLEMLLRGRERQHRDVAKQVIDAFIAELSKTAPVKVEQALSQQGGRLSTVVAPDANKRVEQANDESTEEEENLETTTE